jgi:hypothetical protein
MVLDERGLTAGTEGATLAEGAAVEGTYVPDGPDGPDGPRG